MFTVPFLNIEVNVWAITIFMIAMIGATDIVKCLLKKKVEDVPKSVNLLIAIGIGAGLFGLIALFNGEITQNMIKQYLFAIALACGGYKILKRRLIEPIAKIIKKLKELRK
jgi:uncharacterized membrane protein